MLRLFCVFLSVLVRQSAGKIHELLENPDFDRIMDRVQSESIAKNLVMIKRSADYIDTESTLKKILRIGITNISGFSDLLSIFFK